jgi:dihydroorotate dehydrogenase
MRLGSPLKNQTFHAFVFTAQALPVRNRAEYPGAEKPVLFRFERTVINRFGFGNFAARPCPYLLRRSKADTNAVEISAQIRFFHYIFKTSQLAPPALEVKLHYPFFVPLNVPFVLIAANYE